MVMKVIEKADIKEFVDNFMYLLLEKEINDETILIPKVLGWIVAPTFARAKELWNDLKICIPKGLIKKIQEYGKTIETYGKGVIEVKAVCETRVLAGVGLDVVYVDESSDIASDDLASLEMRLLSPSRCLDGKGGILLLSDEIPQAKPKYDYVAGVDLSKKGFSSLVSRDKEGNITHVIKWQYHNARNIVRFAKTFNAKIVLEAIGYGEALFKFLRTEGFEVEEVRFTALVKRELEKHLDDLIKSGKVEIPAFCLLDEDLKVATMLAFKDFKI